MPTHTLTLQNDDKRTVATLTWHLPPDDREGVVQLLDVQVDEDHRRRGFGKRLYGDLLRAAKTACDQRKVRFRRVWCAVEQRRQVGMRAFLSELGFHHVGTVPNLHRGQDTMVYSKAMD